MEKGLKIINAEIENFKNISYKEVEINGKSFNITGMNGAGKSSFWQALMSPLDSKFIPQEPIKKGEERGSVEIKISGELNGEMKTYNIAIYFSQENQRGRLVITGEDGEAVKGGKKLIQDIVGNISFDIMEFINLGLTSTGKVSVTGVREQIEILKQLMPQETLEQLHNLDVEYNELYAERADVKNKLKYQKTVVDNNPFTQEEAEKYLKPMDPKEVQSKIDDFGKSLEDWNRIDNKVREFSSTISKNEELLHEAIVTVKTLEKLLEEEKKKLKQGEEWLSKNSKPEMGDLNTKMTEINSHNEQHTKLMSIEASRKELDEITAQEKKMTMDLMGLRVKKKELFGANPLPVKGLSFDDEKVLYNDLPLSEGNIPTSHLIAIGCKIGMAMNPNLKVMLIKDGSLLDNKTTKRILSICEKEGYQLMMETVSDDEDVSIEFIEK